MWLSFILVRNLVSKQKSVLPRRKFGRKWSDANSTGISEPKSTHQKLDNQRRVFYHHSVHEQRDLTSDVVNIPLRSSSEGRLGSNGVRGCLIVIYYMSLYD